MRALGNTLTGVSLIDSANNVIGATNISPATRLRGCSSSRDSIIRSRGITSGQIHLSPRSAIRARACTWSIPANNTVNGNVISANSLNGVHILGNFEQLGPSTNNRVLDNVIGGSNGLGNTRDGVLIDNAMDNTVGGHVTWSRQYDFRKRRQWDRDQPSHERKPGAVQLHRSEHGRRSRRGRQRRHTDQLNTLSANVGDGIDLYASNSSTIQGNTISSNSVDGIQIEQQSGRRVRTTLVSLVRLRTSSSPTGSQGSSSTPARRTTPW